MQDRDWYGGRGYRPPSWDFGNRSFGVWDGLFLWTLLSNLDRPGSIGWFHDNQNDQGYQEWRREIDRRAQGDADLRRRIDDLDRQLRERESQPRSPGAVPADIPVEVAKAKPPTTTIPTPIATPTSSSGGVSIVLILVLLLLGGAVAFFFWRRRSGPGKASNPIGRSSASVGSGPAVAGAVDSVQAARRFRVGMNVVIDPSAFVLAGTAIKATPPTGDESGRSVVEAVGRVVSGKTRLVRLYLAGGRHFVQLHLDAAGDPDECRIFSVFDEIEPADADEWGVWLDGMEGMIGWPEFQTKDEKIYDRVWAQSDSRIEPRRLVEAIEDLSGTRQVESKAMLYAAATGESEPAPGTEYLLVSAIEDGGRAWVEIRAGIDINPTTLQLS